MINRLDTRIGRNIAVFLVISILSGGPANACFAFFPISDRLNGAAENSEIVFIARVTSSGYIAPQTERSHPWQAKVSRVSILSGETDQEYFIVGRTGSRSACDDGIPAPEIGDTWVLYWSPSRGHLHPIGYPLDLAIRYDPSLDLQRD